MRLFGKPAKEDFSRKTHHEQEAGDDACPHDWLENLDWLHRDAGHSSIARRCVACGRIWKSWTVNE